MEIKMKSIVLMAFFCVTLSGCFNDAISNLTLDNKASVELVNLIKEVTDKSQSQIKEMSIIDLKGKTKITLSTYDDIEVENKENSKGDIDWWVYFSCDKSGKCEMRMNDEVAQKATKKDFEVFAKQNISKLVKRINNFKNNTK